MISSSSESSSLLGLYSMTRIKNVLFFLFTCLSILSSSHAAAETTQVVQYENKVIGKIDISAVNLSAGGVFNTSAIRARMKTQEGDLFSQSQFDNDLKMLAQEYDRLEPSLSIVNNTVHIALKIWIRPQIRTLRWTGNDSFKPTELQKELGISPGSIFDRLEFNKAFHKLKAFYVKKGYFEAELDYSIEFEPVSNEVDITISVKEGRSGKIEDIIFHNFTSDEQEELLEQMVTKRWSLFTSWLTSDGIYNEDAIQQDQFVIVNYLQNKGYADARVAIEVCESKTKQRIIVHITADKGDTFQIGKLTFEGNTLFTDEQIRAQFTICQGDAYSPEKLRDSITNLNNLYGSLGYIEALIDYEPSPCLDSPVYDLHFTIEEGEQYRVGLIKVFGNCSTQATVILHETLLIPGEVFNITKLKKTEERLRGIGYFRTVNVYAVRSDESCDWGANYRDVHIEVEETNTGNFSAFFGFSNFENLFGGFHITEKNFNYKGLNRVWRDGYSALRGGGEYAHFTTTVGTRSRSYVFSWTKPYFYDTPWIVGFDLEQSNVRYISRDYNINGWGGTLHAKYPINPYLRFGWHYRLRNSDVTLNNDAGEISPQLAQEAQNAGLISATGISLIYDSTNSPTLPTCGFRSRLELEYAGVGGDDNFLGIGYLNSWYTPLGKKGVFKVRGDVKFILPVFGTTYSNMSIDERLYLGGDNSVRGYRAYALGPKYPNIKGEPTDDPAGGLSLNLFSMEYGWRFSKRWELFGFFDAGHLSKKELNIGDFKMSVGYGVRFTIFENGPPLTIGMGYPINEKNRSDIKRFFFTLGASF